MNFSQRNGLSEIRQSLQIDSIDKKLKTKIWNLIYEYFFVTLDSWYSDIYSQSPSKCMMVCSVIWTDFFDKVVDEMPNYSEQYHSNFKEFFKQNYNRMLWHEIYDLLEFMSVLDQKYFSELFAPNCNEILKREQSGYRIIENKVLQTTSEIEISSIEDAIRGSAHLSPVSVHLNSSLALLTNRANPDFRNSVKESISAVEAICAEITKNEKASLGAALSEIEKKFKLHEALKKSFSALYGYTSDSGGIRHKLIEDDIEVSYEDAMFMLVSCTAFINYLRSKM